MIKRALAALIITGIMLSTASSDTEYFIQITGEPPANFFVDEGEAPGGIEIYRKDEFVACVLGYTISTWNGDKLAPISFGFMSRYPLKELVFKPRGAMSRVSITTKETKPDE